MSSSTDDVIRLAALGSGSYARQPATAPLPAPREDCPPRCPSCGGLECWCRPRFFAGQLLTDEDLNRLDRYVVGKNKLHNRYLHGWGVVCGLEVTCDACSPSLVRVRSGYALAPCGEDIVLCRDEQVNVCELVNRCRDDRTPICDDPWNPPPRQCTDVLERWVLAVCYDERPSRGITAVTPDTDNACCTKCGCGGSGNCSCGGKGAAASAKAAVASACGCNGTATSRPATSTAVAKATKAQCEPTLICEGYKFTAYKAKPRMARPVPGKIDSRGSLLAVGPAVLAQMESEWGPMLTRMIYCVLHGLAIRKVFTADAIAAYAAYTEYLEDLRVYAAEHANHNCRLVQALNTLGVPAQGSITAAHFTVLDRMLFDLMLECLCSALLPPCPDAVAADCVPLAVVTIQRGHDCRVVEICNWEERKFAVTFPTLFYWLPKTLFAQVRAAIQRLCCRPERQLDALATTGVMINTLRMKSNFAPGAMAQPRAMMAAAAVTQPAFAAAPAGVAGAAGIGVAAPAAGTTGAAAGAAEETFDFNAMLDRLLEGDETLFRQVLEKSEVGPLAAMAQLGNAPDALRGALAPAMALVTGSSDARKAEEVAELRRMVGDLGERVKAQDAAIAALQKRKPVR